MASAWIWGIPPKPASVPNTGLYRVTATADGPAFARSDGARTLACAVTVADLDGNQAKLASGVTSPTRFAAHVQSVDCGGDDNVLVHVRIKAEDLQAAPSGNYRGTLTLMVAPGRR